MPIEVFNRYEHKYLLNGEQYRAVLGVIESHMNLDPYNENHTPYTIANIYYDTADDFLIRSSLSEPVYKEKLRLRSYGVPQGGDTVFLEIKKKYKGLVNKRRTALNLNEAYNFLNSGSPPPAADYMNPQVLNELEYFLHVYKLMPKLYLAYDRIAYFEKDNPDLRISFDTGIRSRRYDLRLEQGDCGEPLLGKGTYLMEVKTDLAKPLWLTNALSSLNIRRHSFSKYGTEFKRYMHTASNAVNSPIQITYQSGAELLAAARKAVI